MIRVLIWIFSVLASMPVWAEDRAEQALTVSIAAPAYWCPYACDAGGEQLGFTVDIAGAALASAGYRITYQNVPYDRALFEVQKGRTDAAIPAYKDEAPGFIYPDNAVSLSEFCFYVPENEPWRYAGAESLETINFVATSGYAYGETLDTFIANHTEQRVALIKGDNIPQRLRQMVLIGRYNALLDDRLLFESSQSSDDLINAGCLQERHAGYAALSPENPDRSGAIAEAFDRGFERIRANGQLCEILEAYGLGPRFVPGLSEDSCNES